MKKEKVEIISPIKKIALDNLEKMYEKGKFNQVFFADEEHKDQVEESWTRFFFFIINNYKRLSEHEKEEWKEVWKLYRKAIKLKNQLHGYTLYNEIIDFLSNLIETNPSKSGKFVARPLEDYELKQLKNLLNEYKKVKNSRIYTAVDSNGGILVSFCPEEK